MRKLSLFLAGIAVGISGTVIAASQLGSSVFSDVPAGSYYDAAVGELNARGIIKGNNGKFRPGDNVTRAELATVIYRMYQDLGYVAMESSAASSERTSRSSEATSSSSSSSVATTSSSSSAVSIPSQGGLRFATTTASTLESQKGITIAIVRTGGSKGAVGATVTLSDGTAKAGEDYDALTTTVNFVEGETSKTVKIVITDDALGEGSETLTATLSSPFGGAVLTAPTSMAVTITDNESPSGTSSGASSGGAASSTSSGPGKLGFSATAYALAEDAGNLTVTVLRTEGTVGVVSVNYATSNSTAKSGTDYSSVNGTLTFSAGESSKTFTVPLVDNASIDGNRIFNLTLSAPSGGAALGTASTAPVTIVDNETQSSGTGSVKFSKSSYSVTEASGEAIITIVRTGGTKDTSTVNYATSNGTAIAASDYTATSGTMTFLPGESSKTFRIPLLKDDAADSDETINLTLSAAVKAVLTDPYLSLVNIQ